MTNYWSSHRRMISAPGCRPLCCRLIILVESLAFCCCLICCACWAVARYVATRTKLSRTELCSCVVVGQPDFDANDRKFQVICDSQNFYPRNALWEMKNLTSHSFPVNRFRQLPRQKACEHVFIDASNCSIQWLIASSLHTFLYFFWMSANDSRRTCKPVFGR